ncbi:MAG: 3'-5' exonuclease domain-containing protein 2 [Betaproteobacteria bacterium]|nr:3'-5' exonuclease domain-containing protein 2 [Betaproteobacteria bacterium]MBM3384596.1 3'-5' exonuclease domain-containing protein 2 [Betaproteobacteria bacterium]
MPLPAHLPRSISQEEMANLPIRRWEGEVRLVEDARELDRAAREIQHQALIGFDTETRPAFRPGESYPPALAQVATAHRVYLFRLLRLDCSAVLARMLAEPRITVSGVALADDLRLLRNQFPFEPQSVTDLELVARGHGLKQTGLRNLAGIFLGARITKSAKTTNWSAPRLTPQQIAYAATDAWICRELYLRFEEFGLIGP